VVIPKAVFDSLHLQEGDFVEVSSERRLIILRPKRLVDAGEVLTPAEAAKVKRGEAELRRGQSRRWGRQETPAEPGGSVGGAAV